MSSSQSFMPGRVPGNTKHLRRLIEYNSQKAFLSLESKLVGGTADYFCNCYRDKVNKTKQAYNDPSETSATSLRKTGPPELPKSPGTSSSKLNSASFG